MLAGTHLALPARFFLGVAFWYLHRQTTKALG